MLMLIVKFRKNIRFAFFSIDKSLPPFLGCAYQNKTIVPETHTQNLSIPQQIFLSLSCSVLLLSGDKMSHKHSKFSYTQCIQFCLNPEKTKALDFPQAISQSPLLFG